jgi:hypothetical protein
MTTTRFFTAAGRRAVLGLALSACGSLLLAQAPTQAGAIEVSGSFGVAANLPDVTSQVNSQLSGLGVTASGGSGFKWFAGGSVAYALSPSFMIVGETNYNHAGQTNISFSDGSANIGLSLTDFTGGVQWQLPVGSKKFVPYVSAAVGGMREAASASGSGLPANFSATTTDLALEFGGGVRYYVRPSWGIRPEATVVRIPGQTYMRFGVGVFWQSKN